MKNYLVIVALMLLFGCNQQNFESDKANADAVVKGFYSAFEKYDFDAMKSFCTTDFHAIEGDVTLANPEEYYSWLKSFNGYSFHAQMDIVKADMVKDMAFIIYKFDVNMQKDDQKINMQGFESHMLKKVDGKWLIAFYQCSYTNAPPRLEKGSFLGIHVYKDMQLKPGVTEAQVEDFLQNKYIPALNASTSEGKSMLIKSLRGENANKFGIMMYFASEDVRNTYFNQDGTSTKKADEMFKKLEGIQSEMKNLFTTKEDLYTDWLIK